MLIKKLKLNQFRNYENLDLEFSNDLNIIIGKNGSGKTNILESIVFLSNTKPYRTQNELNLIKDNLDCAKAEITTDKENLKVIINQEGKTFYSDDVMIKKTSEVIGRVNAILFDPKDVNFFSSSPFVRRKEIDLQLGKISKLYLSALISYNKYLKQKNSLLKEDKIDEQLLQIINDSLEPAIKLIINERQNFINKLNEKLQEIYSEISHDNSTIKIIYNKCCETDDIFINIELSKEKDMFLKHATFGPHKDDYVFIFNNKNINDIASQGQKRLVMIAFKLAIVRYIKESIKEDVIILLDDVLSELDNDNSEKLLNTLSTSNQIIITTPDIKNIKINRDYKLINLEEIQHG